MVVVMVERFLDGAEEGVEEWHGECCCCFSIVRDEREDGGGGFYHLVCKCVCGGCLSYSECVKVRSEGSPAPA